MLSNVLIEIFVLILVLFIIIAIDYCINKKEYKHR